jgi:hypothetical protein
MAVVMAVVATTMIVIMVMVMVAIMAVVVVICRGRRRNECRRESTQQYAEPYGTADQQPLHGFLPVKTRCEPGTESPVLEQPTLTASASLLAPRYRGLVSALLDDARRTLATECCFPTIHFGLGDLARSHQRRDT